LLLLSDREATNPGGGFLNYHNGAALKAVLNFVPNADHSAKQQIGVRASQAKEFQ
jgi:hypothetical protein